MWTTRFFTEFRDDDQGRWRVDIQAPDYSGAPVRLTPAGNPLEWMSSGSESQTENMIGGTGTLRLLIETPEQMALFTTNGVLPNSALSRRVIVTREAVTVWVGYVQMQTFSQDWEAAPVEIELPLMDTVEALSHIYIDTDETATTTMQLLRSAYAKALQGDGYEREKKAGQTPTGYEVGGVSVTDFARCDTPQYWGRTGPSATKMWSDAQVFTAYYVGPEQDGERKTYAEAITQILAPFGRLSQIGARWFIGKYHTSITGNYSKPNPEKPDKWESTEPADVTDISYAVAGSDNNQSVLPIPSKVTATYRPEEGAVDYSGDSIVEFRDDNIKSNASSRGTAFDVEWTDGEGSEQKSHRLRYLCIGNGINNNKSDSTLDWPVTLIDRNNFRCTWQVLSNAQGGDYDHGPISDRNLEFFDGAVFRGQNNPSNYNRTWRQILNKDAGWKVSETQAYGMNCNIIRTWHEDSLWFYTNYDMRGDIVTLAIDDELVTSDTFALSLKFAMKIERLTDEASFIGTNENTKVWQPMVQLYWSSKKGGTPTRVYDRTTGEWNGCSGYFFPHDAHDVTMVPYSDVQNGKLFHLHEGRGFLSVRIYSSGWPSNGEDMTIEAPTWHHVNNPDTFFVMTGFKLEYEPWVGGTPDTLLAWNESFRDEKTVTYNNGTEELALRFQTLAGAEPTPDAFLAPRWGYNDYPKAVVTRPREMVDIDAVQVTTDSGIPGVTRFSLFQFNGANYYPAAIGMNAKDNTVRLKLIRTL